MKTSLPSFLIVALFCVTLFAQPVPKKATSLPMDPSSARISNQAARSNMLARTGGMIQAPSEGPVVLFLNTQSRVNANAIGTVTDQIRAILQLPITITAKRSKEPVTEALAALTDTNTAVVVVIADSPGYPSLLIAPENRWAMVNVAALNGADVTAETLADRTLKEVWRAFGYLMGAAHSNLEHCLMKSVLTPADLDALKTQTLSPEPFIKIMGHAQKMGITPTRITTYRKAVAEGWAPPPTNNFQQAIWNERKK